MNKIYEKSCVPPDTNSCWEKIDFLTAEKSVKKLQRRIVKALLNLQFDKVEVLQHKLIHSFYAKALAVKIVTSNRGKYTSGTDNVLWITPEEKFRAISELNRRGYKPKPLKRVYIPKSDGRYRPLSIPTMKDRAMQTLYRFALEPIAEILGDDHSYGFRPNRSTRDAIMRCFFILYSSPCPLWILKADIKSCFDNISHEWLMNHIPIDKDILYKFIKNSYFKKGRLHCLDSGVPQGGCISGIICNLTLDGLESKLIDYCSSNVYLIRYADDLLIISDDKELLENSVINVLKSFLSERGLNLSLEKTYISHIDDGFNFLGWNVIGYGENLHISPSRHNIDSFIDKITDILILYSEASAKVIFDMLKPVIDGWLSYHKDIVDRNSLYYVESELYYVIYKWTKNIRLLQFVRRRFISL